MQIIAALVALFVLALLIIKFVMYLEQYIKIRRTMNKPVRRARQRVRRGNK
jgi:hypothetical protein